MIIDIGGDAFPLPIPLHQLKGFIPTEMAGQGRVVGLGEDEGTYLGVRGYHNSPRFIKKDILPNTEVGMPFGILTYLL